MIIDGREITQEIIKKLKARPVPDKIFAAVQIGDDPISLNFLNRKEKTAKELSVDYRFYKFPGDIKNDDLRKEVGKIALLKKVGGVIVQLPLPEHLNKHYILNVIPREKDVDVLGERALGAFYTGRNPVLPPAVGVVEEILQTTNYKLQDKKVAVVGAGFLIGKPVAVWLTDKVKELAVFERGSDLSLQDSSGQAELKNYDLIISGVGKAGLIKPEMLKESAGIIDFGYSIIEMSNEQGVMSKKIVGDFDTNSLMTSGSPLSFYTPTPGGTGPILIAKIFENFFKLCREKS